MKKLAFFLVLALLLGVLSGCTGTPVIYMTNCTCPTAAPAEETKTEETAAVEETKTEETVAAEGALKTGLYIGAKISDSKSATAEAAGSAEYDVTAPSTA